MIDLAFECFELGRIAQENYDHYHAIRWMNEALDQLKEEAENPTIDLIYVIEYLAFSTGEVNSLIITHGRNFH